MHAGQPNLMKPNTENKLNNEKITEQRADVDQTTNRSGDVFDSAAALSVCFLSV